MYVTVVSHVDVDKIANKVSNDEKFWTFAANEWHRLISDYTPMKTGNLFQNVTISPKTIRYNAPYAAKVYFGEHMNFNKNYHPKATAKWDEAAKPEQEGKLLSSLQNYVDSGRLNLNE